MVPYLREEEGVEATPVILCARGTPMMGKDWNDTWTDPLLPEQRWDGGCTQACIILDDSSREPLRTAGCSGLFGVSSA